MLKIFAYTLKILHLSLNMIINDVLSEAFIIIGKNKMFETNFKKDLLLITSLQIWHEFCITILYKILINSTLTPSSKIHNFHNGINFLNIIIICCYGRMPRLKIIIDRALLANYTILPIFDWIGNLYVSSLV